MDKNSLYELMSVNAIPDSALIAHYSFSGASGNVVFNEAFEVSGQNWMSGHYLDWPSSSNLDANKYPAISRKSSDVANSASNLDGSGYFTGDSVLSIGTGVPNDDWTVFISYSGYTPADRESLSNVVLSSSNKPDDTSGFFVGLNSRSLFVESNNTGVQETYTHNKELKDKNIVSVSKDNLGTITLSVHEFSNSNDISSESYELKNYNESNQIFLGGFIDNDVPVINGYTGFSGYIDDFILISGLLTRKEKQDISKCLYASSFSPAGYVTEEVQFVVESGMALVTGVVDSGVTGYENVLVGTFGGTPLYVSSGVTGEITGTFFSGVSGSGVRTTFETKFSGESFSYDNQSLKSYSTPIVSFKNSLGANDVYEIYSQNDKLDSVGLTSTYDRSTDVFQIEDAFSGIDTDGQVGLIYANGRLLESGSTNTGMFVRRDDYSISASGYSGVDTVICDTFKSYDEGQVQYEASYATGLNFTDSKFLDKDIYFEGIKLLSGEHWQKGSNFVDIYSTGYPITYGDTSEGTYIFAPTSKNFTRITGKGLTSVDTNINLINEQVWLNGVRQVRDLDYYLVSRPSKLNTTFRQTPLNTILYSGQTGFYNV